MTWGGDQAWLDLWEQSEAAPPAARPAALLEGLRRIVGVTGEEPADDLPIGRRDRELIELRARLFGPRMDCAATCPACGERLELSFDLGLFGPEAEATEARLSLDAGDLLLRPPTTRDLLAVLADPPEARAAALLRRCAAAPPPEPIGHDLIEAASQALAAADPDADLLIVAHCPNCGAEQPIAFDIGTCLWDDISRVARRLMREVHRLATAYGWTEAEVLATPPRRRREYMLLGSA